MHGYCKYIGMLYNTVDSECAMQKAAAWAIPLLGGGIGAATNDGNRAAGALGGAAGGAIGDLVANKILDHIPAKTILKLGNKGLTAIRAAGTLAGGFGGGKLGSMADIHYGNPLTTKTNEVLEWLKDKFGVGIRTSTPPID